ncbi:MAG: two component transcriptional regulator, LytTR family [Verrucomicrobia bacterium]|nr:two component transcriptional regulator, LytTR family [Verrucomicrobiota bacterium]
MIDSTFAAITLESDRLPLPFPRPVSRSFADRFTVKSEGSFVFLRFAEISWIEAQGDYVKFHAGARSCLARMPMKSLAAGIDPARFLRIHRSTFVNLDEVERITPTRERKYIVVLRTGTRLPISDACWPRVRELYEMALGASPNARNERPTATTPKDRSAN